MSKIGELSAYVGAMGVGKTSLLCSRFNEDLENGLTVLAVKPFIDTREPNPNVIKSRLGQSIPCITVDSLEEVLENCEGIDKVYVDEVQFFDDMEEVEIMFELNMRGIDVEVFGLDLNAMSEDFGVMGFLLARADAVFKLSTKCTVCKENPIRFTADMNGISEEEVKVGDIGEYQPMCKPCYKQHMVESTNQIIDEAIYSYGESLPHPTLDNVTMIQEDMYIVELGELGSDFYVKLVVKPSVLDKIGWSVEDVADIIDDDAVLRLLDEVEELANE